MPPASSPAIKKTLCSLLVLICACAAAQGAAPAPSSKPVIPEGLLLPESVFANIDGQVIHALDFAPAAGPVRAVAVFVHGYGGCAAESLTIGRLLRAQGVRLLAVDMPGCGLSPPFAVCPGMEGYTAFTGQVIAWAESFVPADAPVPFVVSAHSTGAQMLLLNALDWYGGLYGPKGGNNSVARAWSRVSGIFLLAPNGMKGEEGSLMDLRSRWIMDLGHALYSPDIFRYLVNVQVVCKPERADPVISELGSKYLQIPGAWESMVEYLMLVMGNDSLDGKLGPVDLPVKILWGREDHVLAFDWHKKYLAELPHAVLVPIEECGHGIHREQSARVVRELMDFAGLSLLSAVR